MVIAVVIPVVVMLIGAKPRSDFVDKNPTIKMLVLSFLMLIGFTLMAEGFDVHVPEDYLYFAMAFSFTVEVLNIRVRGPKALEVKPIPLSKKYPMIQMSKNQLTGLKTASDI
jgi:predicted tellurium resistance membrane protein TerC